MKDRGILLGEDYDFISPFVIGNTLYQNQSLILILQPAELKLSPATGVGVENMLLDDAILYWKRLIRRQMEMDGQKVSEVKVGKTGSIKLESKY